MAWSTHIEYTSNITSNPLHLLGLVVITCLNSANCVVTNGSFWGLSPEQIPVVNSEGFLAEVFHPWVRWEGPGSGFENSSGAGGAGGGAGAAGGVWAQAGPTWVGPSGWAQAGPKWVGPGYTDLAPLGLRSKNKVFERPG